MDLEKVPLTDPNVIRVFQQLFDSCRNEKMAAMVPCPPLVVEEVFMVSHEQTRAEYLLRRSALVRDCDEGDEYERIRVPSQQVSLKDVLGLTEEPVDANYNEFYLFHGTSAHVAELITDTDFLIKTAADNGWTFGRGVYAAEWVTHAQMFAMMGDNFQSDVCTVLVCRAFAGRCQDAGHWPNTAEPCEDPPVADLEASIADGTFMSTTGSEWPNLDYEVHDFILPDDDQILPEFIVHCRIGA